MSDKPQVYSTADAADYLGVHVQTVKHHIYTTKRLVPDYEFGHELGFLQSTLDAFKESQESGYTLAEAAEYLNVPINRMRYHVYTAKNLVADGKRGQENTFSQAALEAARETITTRRRRSSAKDPSDES